MKSFEDFLAEQQPSQQVASPQKKKGGSFLTNLLQSLIDPVQKTAKTLAGGAYELGRLPGYLATSLPGGQALYDRAAQGDKLSQFAVNYLVSQNPFLSEKGKFTNVGGKPAATLEQTQQNPLSAILNQAKAGAGLVAYGVPFGKGSSFLSKATIPGAKVGLLQGLSEEKVTPTSLALSTGGGAAGASLLRGATNLISRGAAGKVSSAIPAELRKTPLSKLEKFTAGSRPEFEAQLEQAFNNNNFKVAQKIIDEIDDPMYKQSSQQLLNTLQKAAKPGIVEKTGRGLLTSQYEVPKTIARSIKLQDTVGRLEKYGITKIDDVIPAAEQVTGANGAISKATRAAVAKAKPVDTKGLIDLASDQAADTSITNEAGNKFVAFVKKGVQKMLGGRGGTLNNANPSETYGFIQELETAASKITKGRSPTAISSQDIALKNAYLSIAEELKDRLFIGAGGDKALISSNILQQAANQVKGQYPKLAEEILNAKTVSQLRTLAAPFVRGQIAAEETAAGAQAASKSLGGAFKGLGRLANQGLLGPLGLLGEAATPTVGRIMTKVGRAALPKTAAVQNPLLQQILGQVGARAGGITATTPPTSPEVQGAQTLGESPFGGGETGMASEAGLGGLGQEANMGQQNPYPLENFIGDVQRDPKNASIYKYIYEQYQNQYAQVAPKIPAAVQGQLVAADSALNIIDRIESEYAKIGQTSIGPLAGLLGIEKKGEGILQLGNVKSYQAAVEGASRRLIKAMGEVGTLSKSDIEAAVKLIPGIGDSTTTASQKLATLRALIQSGITSVNARYQTGDNLNNSTGGADYLMQMLGSGQ